jgi:hypothetical protein
MGGGVMMTRILFLTSIFLLSLSESALANVPPSPQSLLALISILPIMIFLTLVGGGYAILRRHTQMLLQKGKKPFLPRSRLLKIGGAILLIFISLPVDGPIALVGLLFGVVALVRGIQMVRWALHSLSRRETPLYLEGANPVRLIPAGFILILAALFLAGMPIAYIGYSAFSMSTATVDKLVKDLAAYQIAYSRHNTIQPEESILIFGQKQRPWKLTRLQRNYEIKLDSAQQNRGFTIHLTPTRFPLFPYNYCTSRPSYLVDHAGDIRMVYVHQKTPCPSDAPVVMKLGNDEIQQILSNMHQ